MTAALFQPSTRTPSTADKLARALAEARRDGRTVVLVIESLRDGYISTTSLRAKDDIAAQVARVDGSTNRFGEASKRVVRVLLVNAAVL